MADIEDRHIAFDGPRGGGKPPGDSAKKGGFAAAVRAAEKRHLAGDHGKRQRVLDKPPAAYQRNAVDAQPGRRRAGIAGQ